MRAGLATPISILRQASMQTSHLLHALLLLLLLVSLRCDAEDLLDSAGNAVVPGVKYYMVSATRGAGGGGMLPAKYPASSTCASYVGWAQLDVDRGVPVVISSVNSPDAKSIAVGDKVYIQFSVVDSCVKTPYWTVTGKGLVATGGSRPVVPPPAGTSDNMFLFRNGGISNTYGLSYCPCNLCKMACFDIDQFTVSGLRVLGMDSPSDFTVVLIKAVGSASTEPFPSSLLRTPADSDE